MCIILINLSNVLVKLHEVLAIHVIIYILLSACLTNKCDIKEFAVKYEYEITTNRKPV